jgi:hypothetical protein
MPALVGHRVGCLDDPEIADFGSGGMAVFGDDEPVRDQVVEDGLGAAGHRHGGFADRQDDETSPNGDPPAGDEEGRAVTAEMALNGGGRLDRAEGRLIPRLDRVAGTIRGNGGHRDLLANTVRRLALADAPRLAPGQPVQDRLEIGRERRFEGDGPAVGQAEGEAGGVEELPRHVDPRG